ncbi:MAG TPA: RDD family protein [Steroidobacteraceae bacterium]
MKSGVSAGFGRRFAALLYDALLLIGILVLFTGAAMLIARQAIVPENVGIWAYLYRAMLLLIWSGYFLINWTRSGQTLGMRAWRLRAVTDAGQPMPYPAALLRLPLSVLAWAPAALGVLWLYLDREHAALQDRLSHTRVVHLSRS